MDILRGLYRVDPHGQARGDLLSEQREREGEATTLAESSIARRAGYARVSISGFRDLRKIPTLMQPTIRVAFEFASADWRGQPACRQAGASPYNKNRAF